MWKRNFIHQNQMQMKAKEAHLPLCVKLIDLIVLVECCSVCKEGFQVCSILGFLSFHNLPSIECSYFLILFHWKSHIIHTVVDKDVVCWPAHKHWWNTDMSLYTFFTKKKKLLQKATACFFMFDNWKVH